MFSKDPDFFLLCEFCEIAGPVVVYQYPDLNTAPRLFMRSNGETGSEPVSSMKDIQELAMKRSAAINKFAMRALSSDHVFEPSAPEAKAAQPEGIDGLHDSFGAAANEISSPFTHRTETYIDRVEWIEAERRREDNKGTTTGMTYMSAFVYSFTLPDLLARGYSRNCCLCYLSGDHTKIMSISHWLSLEFQTLVRMMSNSAVHQHTRELREAVCAFDFYSKYYGGRRNSHDNSNDSVTAEQALPAEELAEEFRLSERHLIGFETERDSIYRRSRLGREAHHIVPLPSGKQQQPTTALFAMAQTGVRMAAESSQTISPQAGCLQGPASPPLVALTSPVASSGLSSPERGTPVVTGVDSKRLYYMLLDELIVLKGTRKLRAMDIFLQNKLYEEIRERACRIVVAYSVPLFVLLERADDLLLPLDELLSKGLQFGDPPNGPTTASQSVGQKSVTFNIGDFPIGDPFSPLNDPHRLNSSVKSLTMLRDDELHLYFCVWPYGTQIIYNALLGRPIIVVGKNKDDVARAVKFVSTFVPALLQTPRHRVALYWSDSNDCRRLTPDLLETYVVVGCQKNAALTAKGAPVLGDTALWNLDDNTFIGCAYHIVQQPVPMASAMTPPTYSPSQQLEIGLLRRIEDCLRQDLGILPGAASLRGLSAIPTLRDPNDPDRSFVLLTVIKSVFLTYGTMALQVLQYLADHRPWIDQDESFRFRFGGCRTNLPRPNTISTTTSTPNASFTAEMASATVPLFFPTMVTDLLVSKILSDAFGYTTKINPCDVSIVTHLIHTICNMAAQPRRDVSCATLPSPQTTVIHLPSEDIRLHRIVSATGLMKIDSQMMLTD